MGHVLSNALFVSTFVFIGFALGRWARRRRIREAIASELGGDLPPEFLEQVRVAGIEEIDRD